MRLFASVCLSVGAHEGVSRLLYIHTHGDIIPAAHNETREPAADLAADPTLLNLGS